MKRSIVLLTDFGTQDTYVGVMKGVMRRICPDADFIDLTHAVQSQNVREAALALLNSYQYFPAGTIFLVVIDPGVGSVRRPVAVRAGDYWFVAPDNGVLHYVLRSTPQLEAVVLSNEAYHVHPVSQTFHGRDIFSPAAAHLASGVALAELGPPAGELVELPVPVLQMDEGRLTGEVMHIDHFGNVVTSIGRLTWLDDRTLTLQPLFDNRAEALEVRAENIAVQIGNVNVRKLHRTYSAALPGDVLALVGSGGFLELAINQGNCAVRFGLNVGDQVEVTI